MAKTKKFYDALVIGSGCAGFNAADWLFDLGVTDVAIVTEGVNMGTSRNTGSDKQTYYKLTLAGGEPDSVYEMAQTLYSGGSVHGDTALAEASGSARAFMKLVNLGVPFPTDEYGAFVGYKTDHDPRRRATSCGPLTSKYMTEALERSVNKKGIPILDDRQAVKIHAEVGRVRGLTVINKNTLEYETYNCGYIVLATGGPAGVYADSVFPESQTGGTGLALEAGAAANNLQEWQYGLASVDFRWNVSGTYQQVLPKYISIGEDGVEREFLPSYFDTPERALDMVFLKGYQWPFDTRKVRGSSVIDLIVAKEMYELNRKVYMDFRFNPSGLESGFDKISREAYEYLEKSGALFGKPIDRLAHMNPKSIELYRSNGIDVTKEPLRVAVCAQHCNGGVAVDLNWETTVKGLYAVGEAAGSFGAYRPGGSALNATQVGSMRAAEHIARSIRKDGAAAHYACVYEKPVVKISEGVNLSESRMKSQTEMSRFAAYRRNPAEMMRMFTELTERKDNFFADAAVESKGELPFLHKNFDILSTQVSILSAMILSAEKIGSRGGALVEGESEDLERDMHLDKVIVTRGLESQFEQTRPMPDGDYWFETVWREYEEKRRIK